VIPVTLTSRVHLRGPQYFSRARCEDEEAGKLCSTVIRADRQRNTRAAQEARQDIVEEAEGDVLEQAGVLMKERQAFRSAREEKECKRPLRGLIFDMNREYTSGP